MDLGVRYEVIAPKPFIILHSALRLVRIRCYERGDFDMLDRVLLGVAVLAMAVGFLWRRSISKSLRSHEPPGKKTKRLKAIATMLFIIGAYLFLTRLIALIFGGGESGGVAVEFSLWSERVDFYGFSLSMTVIYCWIVMAALIVAALLIRLTIVRRFREVPEGAQNVIEIIVESIRKYIDGQTHGTGELLCSYVLSIGALMVGCAFLELFGLHAPTSDITMTFALAIMTFVLINAYGIKRKGVSGRIKSLASPTPVVLVFRVISEIAIPVSMACRLFGNTLGGMIVMNLIYSALGRGAVGIPSVVGLFFNVFHPLIQAFIFITLTLTFINEAIE